MSTFSIPVQATTGPFSQQVELDGLLYDLLFVWNARDGHWFLTISRDDEVSIAAVKLVNTLDLIGQYQREEGLPVGTLYIHDLDGLDRAPDATNFGDRILLLYAEAS